MTGMRGPQRGLSVSPHCHHGAGPVTGAVPEAASWLLGTLSHDEPSHSPRWEPDGFSILNAGLQTGGFTMGSSSSLQREG